MTVSDWTIDYPERNRRRTWDTEEAAVVVLRGELKLELSHGRTGPAVSETMPVFQLRYAMLDTLF